MVGMTDALDQPSHALADAGRLLGKIVWHPLIDV
jgi:hypothetical protein